MFKKLSFRILAVIFVALLVVLAIKWYVDNKRGESTFKKELVGAGANEITAVAFTPDKQNPEEVRVILEGGQWKIYKGNKSYRADSMLVGNMISTLTGLKPERVAATESSKWKEFQVDDSTGTKVKLYKNKDLVADLIIGKFSYIPEKSQNMYGKPQGKMSTYVRVAGDNNVYAVEGFINTNYNKNINSLRDKGLMRSRREDLRQLTFRYPADSSFTLTQQGSKWMLNGVVCDSTRTVRYLSTIARLSSADLVDDASFDGNHPAYSLTVEANNMEPVEIKAFPADSVNKFIITSSINEGTYFSGARNKLLDKIFVSRKNFLP
jgi:hypothetical protein